MDSQMTVADARTAMSRFGMQPAEFLRKLNRASERLLKSDVYYDIFSVVEVTTTTGYITMPRRYGRAYGVQIGDWTRPVVGQYAEFIDLGMIRQDPSNISLDGISDMGSHWVTDSEVWANGTQTPGTLRVQLTASADASKVFRFFGTFIDTDSVEKIVYDALGHEGVNLTSVNPTATTTVQFVKVTGIQAPSGLVGRWKLFKVVGTTATQIGEYDPDETRPRRLRYQTRNTDNKIRMLCREMFIPLVADTDWVRPDNVNALEKAFQSQTLADNTSDGPEDEMLKAAKRILKEEYASKVPYPKIRFSSDMRRGRSPYPWGFGGAC